MASDNEHCGDRGRECTITVSNPVLRGMYPDPSWIWDTTREEIVLVNSSFELVPGLPIHTTRDLVTWTRTANAVDETMSHRLLIDGVEDSGGLYAPTIRRIGGRYVIVCTVARVDEVKALAAGCSQKDIDNCRDAQGNFVIEADELTGPWRGPYWVAGAEGIDPDIFEDGDGTVWWTQTRPALHPQWDGQTEIWTQPIAPGTWTLQDHKTVIWRGYGMDAVWAEGPHLYRVGDYLYLMTAEGGTSFEHSEMIMRTHAPRGFAAALAGFEKNLAAQDIWIEPARDGERSVVGHDNRLFEALQTQSDPHTPSFGSGGAGPMRWARRSAAASDRRLAARVSWHTRDSGRGTRRNVQLLWPGNVRGTGRMAAQSGLVEAGRWGAE